MEIITNRIFRDIFNICAGGYQGYMNSAGVDVNPTYLSFILGGFAATDLTYNTTFRARHNALIFGGGREKIDGILESKILESFVYISPYRTFPSNPFKESLQDTGIGTVINSIEMGIGYGIGFIVQKIFN